MSTFRDQLESRLGKARLLHGSNISDQTVTGLTFSDRLKGQVCDLHQHTIIESFLTYLEPA
jgi:hypothetical protein